MRRLCFAPAPPPPVAAIENPIPGIETPKGGIGRRKGGGGGRRKKVVFKRLKYAPKGMWNVFKRSTHAPKGMWNVFKRSTHAPKGQRAPSPGQASVASDTLGLVKTPTIRPRRGQKQRQARSNPPMRTVKSPMRTVKSPMRTVKSPMRTVKSPMRTVKPANAEG